MRKNDLQTDQTYFTMLSSMLVLPAVTAILLTYMPSCCVAFPGPGVCTLPLKVGSCGDNLSRYYFNCKTGECQEFTYKGCDGNKNNFMTKEACETKCEETEGC